ncbi:hypothetical protein CC86DRAFT_409486 [Ophiobolus disseminans]|uniref:Uncharacterized protein n=1 Tax=Ophiobolus disseminans TaxID=1469910 RepID=A0A6A6ZR88_9PLEO|nr:hypothetical protein CC86DRAFT_409486 [Ophiobolus disseminans]
MATEFGFMCPAGGQWYACGATGQSKFVGCCTADPCSTGCAQGNIKPGGFNATMHGKFPDASCGTASNFFSCGFSGTFWGCCKSDACKSTPGATCKEGDLVPAFMERPEQLNAYAPSSVPKSDSKSSNGAVIGGAVGGGVVAAIIIGVLIFFFLRRRRQNQQQTGPESGANAMTPMMKGTEDRHSAQYGQSPPPTYTSPNPNYYQSMSPEKGHPYQTPYQEYRSDAAGPQELPAELSSPAQHRYSELPAESSSSGAQRFSELPAGTDRMAAELESPQVSPRPLQSEFGSDLAKRVNQEPGTTSEERPKEKK